MPKGLQPKGVARRNKMLLAAVQLFLENGYEKTTTAAIARAREWHHHRFLLHLRIKRHCY